MSKNTYTDEQKAEWVRLRAEGYRYKQIAEMTGANEHSIMRYLQNKGFSKPLQRKPENDRSLWTPDVLVRIHDLYLEPECAMRYFQVRAKLGFGHLDRVPREGEDVEQELERLGYVIIRKKK